MEILVMMLLGKILLVFFITVFDMKKWDDLINWLIDWFIAYWLASSKQYYSYIQDENKFNDIKKYYIGEGPQDPRLPRRRIGGAI
jgi:hypothetical protein